MLSPHPTRYAELTSWSFVATPTLARKRPCARSTARVASKRDAVRWAMMHAEPRAGSMDAARELVAYVVATA